MNKTIYKILLFSSLSYLICLKGCNFKDINVDPNNPTENIVGLKNRLPSLQFDMMYAIGGAYAVRISNIMGQTFYKQGPTGFNNYLFSTADANNQNTWNDMYSTAVVQAKQIIELSDKENNPHYAGIAKILLAVNIATISSVWGDVPFSETGDAINFPFPKFDSQEIIYNDIQSLLDEAINDLNKNQGKNPPTNDDLFFKGNATNWIKVAYSLKARYYLHLIKIDESNYDKSLQALQLGITSNEGNAIFRFQSGASSVQAPLFRERSSGDTRIDNAFGILLKNTLADPREKFYGVIENNLLLGVKSEYGPFYNSQNSYFPLITFEECEFMKAEIEMKKGNKIGAEAKLKSAIYSSLVRVCSNTIGSEAELNLASSIPGSVLETYSEREGSISTLSDADAWKRIFQQKWIAMFMQTEPWNDYRRTEKYVEGVAGLPEIPIRQGSRLPRRMYYPAGELNANKNAPSNISDIYQRVWWDTQ